jgi:hypothetical protein
MLGQLDSAFYDATPLQKVAINLFYGWGYNFYRLENQLRADDLLVRHQVAGLVGEARVAIGKAEASFREERLPELSRAKPRHDPEALKGAHALEALVAKVGAVASRIRSQPVPENDRISQHHRREDDTLARLLEADMALSGHAATLLALIRKQTPDWLIANSGEVEEHLRALEEALGNRAAILKV